MRSRVRSLAAALFFGLHGDFACYCPDESDVRARLASLRCFGAHAFHLFRSGRQASRGRRASGVHPASERVREPRASVSRNAWRCERAASKRWCLMAGDANGRLRSEPAAAQGYSGQKPLSGTRTSSISATALCSRTSSKTDTEGV